VGRLVCEHCLRPTRTRYDVGGWYVCRRCRDGCSLVKRCRWEDRRARLAQERTMIFREGERRGE
jgi:hypothetical protein